MSKELKSDIQIFIKFEVCPEVLVIWMQYK